MRTRSTLIGVFYIGSALVLAWLLTTATAATFGALRINDAALVGDQLTASRLTGIVLAAAIAVTCYLWSKPRTFVGHVAEELDKVNWPSWPETKVNTLVVIATSVIAALVLGVFDITFSFLSTWLATHA